ncbi:helix-turn-helix domain-containing protein [Sinorhizobium meliloti]|uniref:helix-turn-helix domain-containing protein n=1 Tax=Rhizobium meliloti TaxID=382 RepID=UPI0013E3CA8E|nr:helix-turn-helix domain-containing protein [Sinorhizobium meliloti]
MRQHEAYKAVRERLFRMPKPAPAPTPVARQRPQLVVLRDYDAHVITWRKWLAFLDAIKASSTSTTVSARFGPYANCSASFALGEDFDMFVARRSMRDICIDVLQGFPGVTLDEVKGPRRSRNIVAARQACMFAVYTERKDASFPMIGRFFGGRDHTTALHAIRKIEANIGRRNEK